jgi:hypothetical protein
MENKKPINVFNGLKSKVNSEPQNKIKPTLSHKVCKLKS